MIADCCEEFFDFFLMNIPRQVVDLVDITSLGDDWISNVLLANICQVVVEHVQGDQSLPDGCLCSAQALLPSGKLIQILNRDGNMGLSTYPSEQDAHIAGVMQRSTAAWLSPLVLFKNH